MDAKEAQKERIEAFNNIYTGVIPTRVPIQIFLSLECIAEMYGVNMIDVQWDPSLIEEAADKVCQVYFSDICPYKGALRTPAFYQLLGSTSYKMSSGGFIQHPEVHCMEPEDYDEFIQSPFDTIIEKFIPRQYKSIDPGNPFRMAMQITKAILAKDEDLRTMGGIQKRLIEKYGYFKGKPGIDGACPTPFDFIADELRGFTGMSVDIRRRPQQVLDACEAILPLVIKSAMPAIVDDHGHVGMMMHMPSFMKTKDFEKFYWPTYKKMIVEFASRGVHSYGFCEGNWDRYLGYLYELPVNTFLAFEHGDAQLIKDTIGSRHVLMGLYPMEYLRTRSKEDCVDEVKRLLDIMMPGGRYIFKYDKGPITKNDFILENAQAVHSYIYENARYDNPGEKVGQVFRKEDYQPQEIRPFESKYWDSLQDQYDEYEYLSEFGAKRLAKYEEKMARFFKGLVS